MSTIEEQVAAITELVEGICVALSAALEPIDPNQCPNVVGLALGHHVAESLKHMHDSYGGIEPAQRWLSSVLSVIARHPSVRDVLRVKFTSEVRAIEFAEGG